ncbi:MAG: hypothetical protein GX801_00005, partial [Fibrobacter sp.]|nr:hypothetical protein [Fibrobacter sp.]
QNHHQGLFIQFLIALLALFAGFGYVYVHTIPDISYTQTFVESKNGVEYFSNQVLLGTSFVVLAVLLLLNAILINQGYGFRRDQNLNVTIRKEYLKGDYHKIFKGSYNAADKGFFDFLPDFYSIFFCFIFVFQITILVAICFKENFINFSGNYLALIVFIADVLLLFLSPVIYGHYYCKYKSNLKYPDKDEFKCNSKRN